MKLDKSSEVKAVQFLNILAILVTAEVSKLNKSSDVKAVQPLNEIAGILSEIKKKSTFDVSSLNLSDFALYTVYGSA